MIIIVHKTANMLINQGLYCDFFKTSRHKKIIEAVDNKLFTAKTGSALANSC